MRKLMLALSLLALAACGSDSPTAPPAPTTAQVYFKVDAVSCTGSDLVTLYIDGSVAGTQQLSAGGTAVGPYTVVIGTHLLGAKEVNAPFFVWPSTQTVVPAGGITWVLFCN